MSAPPSRWLFVVARERGDVYAFMNRDTFLDPDAAVVSDRRVGDRRGAFTPGAPERRVCERRQLQATEHLGRYGFAVIDRRHGRVVPPAAPAGMAIRPGEDV